MINYNLLIFIPPCIGLLFSLFEYRRISNLKLNGSDNKDNNVEGKLEKFDKMKEVASYIDEGSSIFLKKKYQYLAVITIIFYVILLIFVNSYTAASFFIGCLTSILVGYIGVKIDVYANLRATNEVCKGLDKGHKVIMSSSAIVGFTLVSLNIIVMGLTMITYNTLFLQNHYSMSFVYKIMAGFGLGSSSVALFSRGGVCIYTKSVNLGSNLSENSEYKIPENDLRNPACIADNIGNVVGVSTDLFGSLAESLCAVLILGSSTITIIDMNGNYYNSIFLPLIFISFSIISGIISFFLITLIIKIKSKKDINLSLKLLLILVTILQTIVIIVLGYLFITDILIYNYINEINKWQIIIPVLVGLWSSLLIGLTSELYTSSSYKLVQEIVEAQKTSAATGILNAISLGYRSTLLYIICIGFATGISYWICDVYGVALAAIGMLSTLCICATICTYGPIANNSNEMVEVVDLSDEIRENANALDLVGNTASSIGNGFSIGSAALVSFALLGAYIKCANLHNANILNPWVIIGLFTGLTLPYVFSSLTLRSVTIIAKTVFNECLVQFPLIMTEKQKPDYLKCIQLSINASLKHMILPGLISLFSPLVIGMLLGKNATAGLLIGIILSGVHLAFSSTNTGGALYNANKHIESGALGSDHCKGSNTNQNSIIGAIVGDPLRGTSAPSLNILIKLPTIISVIFASIISEKFTSYSGGPIWL